MNGDKMKVDEYGTGAGAIPVDLFNISLFNKLCDHTP